MSLCTPIVLSGDNLGLRHRHLNVLVTEAIQQGVPFQQIQNLPEQTPVDRLFKIDVASKLRNVDYILKNIKDEDMLYVSRALKAKWLLERQHQDVINPKYLEENLYPYMVTTAVSKFKHWLYVHLKDSQMCEIFYNYYSKTKFEYALKFLRHCNVAFIISEAPNILEKLSPHHFKFLCEKCPQVAKIYFDNVLKSDELKIKFLNHQQGFFNSLKVVLKLDADIFFEITEKYFSYKYNRSFTKYIMAHHKDRFEKKPELYAGMLLNMPSLAECLSSEESKELVLKLVRASYLNRQIDYKFVEPLIKRVLANERVAFKNKVFKEKSIGELVVSSPYDLPSLPINKSYNYHVFDDYVKSYDDLCVPKSDFVALRQCCLLRNEACVRMRTYLDKLFDEYRFMSFERTLFELRRKITEQSTPQNRQYMFLVLISKSGGKPELVASLLQLLEQHLNEPTNVRSAVVRSLVKRAAVWRLPQQSWEVMLKFARGLGLDGREAEADCREGLHAVVIRSLLGTDLCEPAIREAFLKDFSHLDEYPINSDEHKIIKQKLPELLLAAVGAESSPVRQAKLLTFLLDMLQQYKVDIGTSLLIPAVVTLAKHVSSAAEGLLRRLFNAKIARRVLFREFFPLIQTDASYLNALRHDASVLNVSKFVDLVERDEIRPEQFLRKMAIYFAENSGLTERYLMEMKQRVLNNESVGKSLARPICLLQGACLDYLASLDTSNKSVARLASAIRANMHAGRPKLNMNDIVFSTIGPKAVANKVLICPLVEVDKYVHELMTWKRTVGVALVLAKRTGKESDAFVSAATLRPTATVKAALKYLRRTPDFNPHVFEVFKLLINKFDLCTEKYTHLRKYMTQIDDLPLTIKADYYAILHKALRKTHHHDAMVILSNIETLLDHTHEDFLEELLLNFLQEFDPVKYKRKNDESLTSLHIRVLIKFLLLCKSEEIQRRRFTKFGEPLLTRLKLFLNNSEEDFMVIFNQILSNLQFNKAFFDNTYISPLPVLENVVTWMRQCLPIELHFVIYVRIHLTMLYLKSVRLNIQLQPDVFNNEKTRLSEGIQVVGHTFGKKIAQEIKELMKNYFESVVELYHKGMNYYFVNYFNYDVTKFQFIKAVVQGILESSTGAEVRSALYLVQSDYYNFDSKDLKELLGAMNNIEDETFKYFLCSEISIFRSKLMKLN